MPPSAEYASSDLVTLWKSMRHSVTFKLFSMFFLFLFSLLPVTFIQELVHERQSLQLQATQEVNQKWADPQTVAGPVLTLPYRKVIQNGEKKAITTTAYLHLLPTQVKIQGEMLPQKLSRGIYDMIVYNARLQLNGHFEASQFQNLPVPSSDLLWDQAFISIGLSDLRGIAEQVQITWAGKKQTFDSGAVTEHLYPAGIHTLVPLSETLRKTRLSFDLNLQLKGNQMLYFLPVGQETQVSLSAPWPDPSFDGAFLPEHREVSATGFEASWKVLHLNRNFPQIWKDQQYSLEGAAFGVHLIQPVDHYQKVLRSVKYAMFFIGLTFLSFFFIEVLTGRMVHPLQYLLIGFGLCVFYTLLLSICEHIGFEWAYLIATSMTVGLITSYAAGFLRSWPLTGLCGGVLVLLYGFIYVILKQQDYALLMGSLGLFGVLALVMFFSRKLDLGGSANPAQSQTASDPTATAE